jgi:hypothetical protein
MTRFLDAALTFPTALFSFLLVVAIGYWAVVLLSVADPDPFATSEIDAGTGLDAGTDAGSGLASVLTAAGLGGLPVTVVLTALIALAWFLSLAGTALIDGVRGPLRGVLWVALLPLALGGAWLATRSLAVPLRRMLPDRPPPSRRDFVGRTCVVRTGEVGLDFGQAEVTAADGSTAIIQVRLAGTAPAGAGWTAIVYEYDPDDETFWIAPVDPTP